MSPINILRKRTYKHVSVFPYTEMGVKAIRGLRMVCLIPSLITPCNPREARASLRQETLAAFSCLLKNYNILTGGSGRCALFLLRSVSITKPHRAPTHTHILTQSMIHQSLHSMEVHTKVEIRIWKIRSMYSRVPNKHVALLFYFRKFFPLTISHNKKILFFTY